MLFWNSFLLHGPARESTATDFNIWRSALACLPSTASSNHTFGGKSAVRVMPDVSGKYLVELTGLAALHKQAHTRAQLEVH